MARFSLSRRDALMQTGAAMGVAVLKPLADSAEAQVRASRPFSIPDSKIVREAQNLAKEVSEPYLFNHVMRSCIFATALAQFDTNPPDPELLAVAALLHDLGLTEKYATATDRFEIDGANAARSFLQTHGLAVTDVQLVWDAISLHSTRSIALHKQSVVAYCHRGVQVDISGTQLGDIESEVVEQALHHYPRLSLKSKLTSCLCDVVRRKPSSTYDNFMRDFGERYVNGYRPVSSVDRLEKAPFES